MEISGLNQQSQSFILLINVTNANNYWHFNIYQQSKFYAQLSSEWIKVYNPEARCQYGNLNCSKYRKIAVKSENGCNVNNRTRFSGAV